jgi:hypothetical protein
MASENSEILNSTWELIQRTRREIAQVRIEIQNALDTLERSRQVLARAAAPAKSTESAHDSA